MRLKRILGKKRSKKIEKGKSKIKETAVDRKIYNSMSSYESEGFRLIVLLRKEFGNEGRKTQKWGNRKSKIKETAVDSEI